MSSIIKFPLATEKSVRLIDSENTLVFMVARTADKKEIKEAIEKQLNVKIVSVNTLHDSKGGKRAYVRFSPETPALDAATKLGLM